MAEEFSSKTVSICTCNIDNNRFTKLKYLGKGSYGKVILAIDQTSKQFVVMKHFKYEDDYKKELYNYIKMQDDPDLQKIIPKFLFKDD